MGKKKQRNNSFDKHQPKDATKTLGRPQNPPPQPKDYEEIEY